MQSSDPLLDKTIGQRSYLGVSLTSTAIKPHRVLMNTCGFNRGREHWEIQHVVQIDT